MLYILSIFTGMLGAFGGWTIGVMAATAAGNADNMAASFVIALLTGVAGFIVAVALTLYVKGGVQVTARHRRSRSRRRPDDRHIGRRRA